MSNKHVTQPLLFLEDRCSNNYLAGFLALLWLTPSHSRTNSGKRLSTNKNEDHSCRNSSGFSQDSLFILIAMNTQCKTKFRSKDIKEYQMKKYFTNINIRLCNSDNQPQIKKIFISLLVYYIY